MNRVSVPVVESVDAAKGPEPEGRGYGGYGGGHVVSEYWLNHRQLNFWHDFSTSCHGLCQQ